MGFHEQLLHAEDGTETIKDLVPFSMSEKEEPQKQNCSLFKYQAKVVSNECHCRNDSKQLCSSNTEAPAMWYSL